MKQADEAINRVLTGLRESEAQEGMEGRVLRAMQARAAVFEEENSAWWRASWPRLFGYGAVLAGLLMVTAVLTPHWDGRRRTPVVEKRVESGTPVTATQAAEVTQTAAKRRVAGPVLARTKIATGGQAVVTEPDSNAAEDALAREEMLAPSHPTPPLPMTAQEKLLERVVNRHDPDELAMLNPEEREKVAARDDEAFKRFFGIADPGNGKEHDGDSDQTGASGSQPEAKAPEVQTTVPAVVAK